MNAVLLLIAAPLAFSAAVAGLRRLAARDAVFHDNAEKALLGLMLLPLLAGVLILVVPMPAPVLAALPLPALAGSDDIATTTVAATAATPHIDLMHYAPQGLLTLWAIGAAIAVARLILAVAGFARIAKGATTLDDGTRTTHVPAPAFAWRGQVVVPQALRQALTPTQLRLIVAHERAHLSRRDPLWFLFFGIVDAGLWFNPFVTAQTRACRLAAELACDAAAISTGDRHAYAQALIAALKLPHATSSAVPALSAKTSYKQRLDHIMTRRPAPKAFLWLATATALAVAVTFGQFAFAKAPPAVIAAPLAAVQPDTPPAVTSDFIIPVDGQIGDRFGMRHDPFTQGMKFHQGIDFVAPTGTPIKASATGTVSFVGSQPGYGNVIEIDLASGLKTRYAHLNATNVAMGDQVTQGQVIGTVGSTGKSTQPHLHFEIWQDGKAQDPAPYLGLPALN